MKGILFMSLIRILEKYSLSFFFILSYLLMIIPVIIYSFGVIPEILLIIMIWSPTISAIIMSGVIGGWEEIKKLLKGFLKWKVGIKWYFAAFLLMIGPLIFAGIYILVGGSAPGPTTLLTVPIILVNLLLTFLYLRL